MKNLIDTHFHLDHYRNYLEVAAKITELKQYTICVTNSPGVFLSCQRMIPETQYLKFAIGYHPQDRDLSNQDLYDFMRLIDRTDYIGEIGLDFSKSSYMSKSQQVRCFETIVERCTGDNKLMTLHIRNAETEAITILRKYVPKKVIIHWFTGSEKHMAELMDMGCYFSINSNMVVGRNSKKYILIPKEKVLIESDGPYTKVAGKKYTPESLLQSYNSISQFYGNPNLIANVFENFKNILSR
ncbi:TatD family hydrolase [Desulfosporosinus sp. FKB]|uniref:TatD family hydrolase n=1 Tax=Desulfosporosinus sp. FKB TaxID=1969835 RepID=UPI000B49940F|nr:TatD family hydrolase [Desulfosporosinus sp. FKB]